MARDPLAGYEESTGPLEPVETPRRRRVRMGQMVKGLGSRGRATTTGATDISKLVEARQRGEKVKRLTTGGRSKGEAKGYGAASGRTEPPAELGEQL